MSSHLSSNDNQKPNSNDDIFAIILAITTVFFVHENPKSASIFGFLLGIIFDLYEQKASPSQLIFLSNLKEEYILQSGKGQDVILEIEDEDHDKKDLIEEKAEYLKDFNPIEGKKLSYFSKKLIQESLSEDFMETISSDENVNFLLNVKLAYIRFFLPEVLQYFKDTSNIPFKGIEQAQKHLIEYYSNQKVESKVISFEDFSINHQIKISHQTSKIYTQKLVAILSQGLDEFEEPKAVKQKKLPKVKKTLSTKEARILMYYLKEAKVIPGHDNTFLGEIASNLFLLDADNLSRLKKENIEPILQEGGVSKKVNGNANSIIAHLETVIELIKADIPS